MKKVASWIFAIAVSIFVIDWGIMGLKIFNNDYNITVEAYIVLVCFLYAACITYSAINVRTAARSDGQTENTAPTAEKRHKHSV